jgi:hypothetical protein
VKFRLLKDIEGYIEGDMEIWRYCEGTEIGKGKTKKKKEKRRKLKESEGNVKAKRKKKTQ